MTKSPYYYRWLQSLANELTPEERAELAEWRLKQHVYATDQRAADERREIEAQKKS